MGAYRTRLTPNDARPGGLPVALFMYHGFVEAPLRVGNACFIRRAEFHSQLLHIRRRFRVISFLDAVRYLQGEMGLGPGPLAVITIDDGFYSTYEIAYPILCQERIPAAYFR
jgi:hypothetical protein